MSVSSTTTKNSHAGNGSTTAFAYGFKVFAAADLEVIIRSSTGVETTKSLSTHYNVSGVGQDAGGTVTFTSGNTPASGETVLVRRKLALTQGTDFVENDPFPAQSHEDGLDRLTFITQGIQEELDRAIKVSKTNTLTSSEFSEDATARQNKLLAFDGSGNLDVTQEVGTFRSAWASGTSYAVRDIVKDTSNGNIHICITAHQSSGSQPLLTNSDAAKWGLLSDAASATASQVAAAASAAAAATSETNSANSATASASSASSSSSSASTSTTQAGISTTKASEAAASFDSFDDRFLGAKASDPTVDNDGDTLIDGALYFDTTNNVMKVRDQGNTTWLRTTPTTSDQTAINTVNSNATNINTVAGISGNVTTVAGISSDVTTVAGNNTNVTTVASNNSNISTVAGISSDVTSVAAVSTQVSAVGAQFCGYEFNTSTNTAVSPGNGKLAFNNGTLASVTQISIADVDIDGNNLEGFLTYFDDSTNTTSKATVSIRTGDRDVIWLNVISISNETGFVKFNVQHISSAGTFNANERVFVGLSRTGDVGQNGTGSGTVVGPSSSTDNALVRWDTTTGELVQNSTATLSDSGALSTASVTLTGSTQHGVLLGGGSGGAVASTALGSAGQALTSNGAGSAPTYQDIPGGPGVSASGTAEFIRENAPSISSNVSITANRNAFSAGPISISGSATLTIPSNSRYHIIG